MKKEIKQIRDICFPKEYQSRGEQKVYWMKCGSLFIYTDGSISLKLDLVPTKEAWLQAFAPKEKTAYAPREATRAPVKDEAPTSEEDIDIDSLPF